MLQANKHQMNNIRSNLSIDKSLVSPLSCCTINQGLHICDINKNCKQQHLTSSVTFYYCKTSFKVHKYLHLHMQQETLNRQQHS